MVFIRSIKGLLGEQMSKQRIEMKIEGFWRADRLRDMPPAGGIYCVYEARMKLATGEIRPERLLYVGSANNVRQQISGHQKQDEWRKHLKPGNHLAFSYATVPPDKRKYAEAALVHEFKPVVNTVFKDNYPFDRTILIISGKTDLMKGVVTVKTSK